MSDVADRPPETDHQTELRRQRRFHWILAGAFTLMTIGAAIVFIDGMSRDAASIWYVIVNFISGLGFLSLIVLEIRAARRASRELAESQSDVINP